MPIHNFMPLIYVIPQKPYYWRVLNDSFRQSNDLISNDKVGFLTHCSHCYTAYGNFELLDFAVKVDVVYTYTATLFHIQI